MYAPKIHARAAVQPMMTNMMEPLPRDANGVVRNFRGLARLIVAPGRALEDALLNEPFRAKRGAKKQSATCVLHPHFRPAEASH